MPEMKTHGGGEAELERIHAALDGEISEETLNPAERELFLAMKAAVDESAAVLMSEPVPDLTSRVMAALPTSPSPAVARGPSIRELMSWLWAPRRLSLSLRPAYAFAAAALLVLVWDIGGAPSVDPSPVLVEEAAGEAPVLYVQFRVDLEQASQVAVAGSFTDWQPAVQLTESAPGVWSALVALEPGVHDYSFVVDGELWVNDPVAPEVDDGFGGTNNRLFLTRPLDNA
ncbi:MAG: glycogen-binding domain-containing protein [Gemmatimonadota bacterium]